MWEIIGYKAEMRGEWDSFVKASRQGTLLHLRGYMDYHSDRFADRSLIALRGGKMTALLPANITADARLCSHQGLTYGGWLTPIRHFTANDMLELFDQWLKWCSAHNINDILYKPVPSIYHRIPSDEDLYALFRHGATLSAMNLSTSVDLTQDIRFSTQQTRNFRKAQTLDPWIRETSDASELMTLVEDCLRERHGASPVHTAEEMQRLKNEFPDNIRMWLCGVSDRPEAGICIYDTAGVAHCQYIATTAAGREHGLLTFLMYRLMTDVFSGRKWFDMGTSNEDAGRVINPGLIRQKTGLGGSGVAYPIYLLKV